VKILSPAVKRLSNRAKEIQMLLYTLLTVFSSQFSPDEIKNLRQALGLTQAKFANKLRVSRVVVAYWETGKKIPSRISEAKLEKLALSLNCKLTPPKPAPTLEGSLWQSKENLAWTPEAIKNFRRLIGWTQAQLATALQTSQDIISQWEAGKYRPSPEHQLKLDQLATQLSCPFRHPFRKLLSKRTKRLAKHSQKSPDSRDPAKRGRQAPQVKRQSKKSKLMAELEITDVLFDPYAETFAKNRLKYAQSPPDYVDWFTPYRLMDEKQFYYPLSDVLILRNFIPEIKIATRAADTVDHVDIDLDNPQTMEEHAFKINDLFSGETMTLKSELSGHLTVLIRTLPYSPFGMHHLMERILWVHLGLKEKDGDLEIFQKKDRARRLPMFNGHLLMENDLEKEQEASVKEKIEIFFKLPPIALHEYVVPFEEYLEKIEIENPDHIIGGGAGYHKTKSLVSEANTPRQMEWDFGVNLNAAVQPLSPQESQSEFASRVYDLFTLGLTKKSTRHNAETDFILHFFRCGISEDLASELIEGWYREGKTNGYSKEWEADPERVIRRMRRHVTTFYRWLNNLGMKRYGYSIDITASLTYPDVREIMEMTQWDLKQAEFCFDLITYAKERRDYITYLFISQKTWQSFKNGSKDGYLLRQRQALSVGLIECISQYQSRNVDPSLISRPNVYRIKYEFKEGIEIGRGKTLKQALAEIYSREELRRRFKRDVYQEIVGIKKR